MSYPWEDSVYTREMANIAMCGLMADVHACVDLGNEDDDNVYECACAVRTFDSEGRVSKAIIEFIENAVHAAITNHQKAWDK